MMLDVAGYYALVLVAVGAVPVGALAWWTLPDLILDRFDLPVRRHGSGDVRA